MAILEGVGDELIFAAVIAATTAPLVYVCVRSTLGNPLDSLKQGVSVIQRLWEGFWSRLRGQGQREVATAGGAAVEVVEETSMDAPPAGEICSVCHDSFTLPCQANCAHWFCGECILRVWQHGSALQPCKCPICRRPIILLIPSDEFATSQREQPEADRILQDLAKYNRIFGGEAVSIIQRIRDMPLLLRRMVWELTDPQRAIPLVNRIHILFCLVCLAVYVFSPLDLLPEGILGVIGFLDDLLVLVMVLFHLSMLYRSTLIRRHGGHYD